MIRLLAQASSASALLADGAEARPIERTLQSIQSFEMMLHELQQPQLVVGAVVLRRWRSLAQ